MTILLGRDVKFSPSSTRCNWLCRRLACDVSAARTRDSDDLNGNFIQRRITIREGGTQARVRRSRGKEEEERWTYMHRQLIPSDAELAGTRELLPTTDTQRMTLGSPFRAQPLPMNLLRLSQAPTCASRAYRLCLASQICRKISTTSRVHPLIRDFTSKLAETRPTYRVSPEKISVLHEPKDFLDTLLVSLLSFCLYLNLTHNSGHDQPSK